MSGRWDRLHALAAEAAQEERLALGRAMRATADAIAVLERAVSDRDAGMASAASPLLHDQAQRFWLAAQGCIDQARVRLAEAGAAEAAARDRLLDARRREQAMAVLVERERRAAALAARRRLERDVQERVANPSGVA